jgi:DNA-binding response OmpR family regulator
MFPVPRAEPLGKFYTSGRRVLSAYQSVLLVDCLEESREVLRTALQRRGWRVLEARQASMGLAIARLHRPNLILLDLEAAQCGAAMADQFAEISQCNGGMLVILGNCQPAVGLECTEVIAKPYHYKPLILRIEQLLQFNRRRVAA